MAYSEKTTPFNWTCSVCGQPTTIGDYNYHYRSDSLYRKSKDGDFYLAQEIIVCPNPSCNKATVSVGLMIRTTTTNESGNTIAKLTPFKEWQLLPSSTAKPLHEDVPKAVVEDYSEGSEILTRSPKSAATLARRAIQGMIRHFFKIDPNRIDAKGNTHKKTLSDEIEEITPKIDSIVKQAIDAVREVGAIGAHMEENVDLIINVKPEEARALLGLVEFLSKEWYQKQAQQITDVLEVAKIAKSKKLERIALKKTIS